VLPAWPTLLFTSVPSGVLTAYDDFSYCENRLLETSREPLRYRVLLPQQLKSLEEWIGGFSQGKGREGQDLYDQCDRDCSPRYRYRISVLGSQLEVQAEVICGHARDRNQNR